MKRWLQSFLLGLYRVVQASGIFSTRWGGGIFEWAYHRYKRLLEAGDIRVLAACIKPGAVVIDVGANIGFFTKFFGERVSAGGRVIAIEPEAANFARLNQMICACGLSSVVETIQAVAAERSGTLRLAINRAHPADHKLAAEGVPVTALALDTLLAERQWPSVCLIKVDVQGAEAKVLGGAQETLRRFHPALFLEVDDEALRAMQSEATGLFRELVAQGYHIHRIVGGKISPPMKIEEAVEISRGGKYGDFLLLHVAAVAATSPAA